MDEYIYDARASLARGLVQSIEDGGQAQAITVIAHDGHPRAGVEVMQPFGLASNAPVDGAITLLLQIGGDPANIVALTVANPSVRLGDLLSGESALYGADASRVHIRQGGTVHVFAATEVLAQVGDTTLSVTAAGVAVAGATTFNGNVTIDGDLQVNGNINATGTITGA